VGDADRIAGCLFGGAVGDALGAPVEFMSLERIREAFGPQGIQEYAPAYGRLGAITDDTQMTLFTAEGLLRARVNGSRPIAGVRSIVSQAYERWLRTQGESSDRILGAEPEQDGWLLSHRELWSRRSPGHTCIDVLRDPPADFVARNHSKGCGGIIRIAPVGLVCRVGVGSDAYQAFELGAELAALTHGHPSGYVSSGYFAQLIAFLMDGHALRVAVELARSALLPSMKAEEVVAAIERASVLADEDVAPTSERIERLGSGWTAEEALSIALYCALVAEDFEHGIRIAVNHGGDSDSTGALTGSLLGVMGGIGAIGQRWLAPLELHDAIAEIAADLARLREGAEDDETIAIKYPRS